MEVDVVDGNVVNPGFGPAKQVEGVTGQGLHLGRQAAVLDEAVDLGERPPVNVCVRGGFGLGHLFVNMPMPMPVQVPGAGLQGVRLRQSLLRGVA